jgi:hypothetical protein
MDRWVELALSYAKDDGDEPRRGFASVTSVTEKTLRESKDEPDDDPESPPSVTFGTDNSSKRNRNAGCPDGPACKRERHFFWRDGTLHHVSEEVVSCSACGEHLARCQCSGEW